VAGSGPLVVFLHGIGGNRHSWDRQLAAFSRGFTAVAWDARGYGDSDDYEGPLDFADFSRDLVRVLDHFGAARSHLVGLSMGGRIARDFALRYPDRVAALVLANTSPGFDALSGEEQRRFVAERRNLDPEALAQRLVSAHARPGAREELVSSFRALRRDSYLKAVEASVAQDRAARLEDIKAPTLVVTSDEDPLYPPALARAMAQRIPAVELVEIAGSGHVSNLEQPERFNQVVLEFLARRRYALHGEAP
jgi:3-oxoadipate enol-lactonase